MFSIYIDDLITDLKQSGYGAYIGNIYAGCFLYADDIVLLSPTCHCLQKLITVCEQFGRLWDLKFNSLKSQLATFGSKHSSQSLITLNNTLLQWVDKVKYLGVYIVCRTAMTAVSSNVRQFYNRFNNVLSVIGKGSREMCMLHLNKVYCLTSLSYGCEMWTLNEQSIKRVNVAWNNSFRHIFDGF